MKCPNCKNKIVQKVDGTIRLRIKGKIEFKGERCLSSCFWCGSPVDFYFPLGDMSNLEGYRFVVKEQ